MSAQVQPNLPNTYRFSVPTQWGVAILGVILATLVNVLIFLPQIMANQTDTIPPPAVWTDPPENIELFAPIAGAGYHSPIDVTGFSQTFEGNVVVRLLDSQDEVIAERSTIGGSVQGFDFFHTYLRFTTTEVQDATLEVFEISAEDGSRLSEIQVPITIRPGQRLIDLHAPEVGSAVCSPVVISGYSNTFEATVNVDLRARDGELSAQGFTQGGTFGVYADFTTSLAGETSEPQPLLVTAYEESAETGQWIDPARVPVSLYPPGTGPCS